MSTETNNEWSVEALMYLKENYKTMRYKEIAAHLGKKAKAVGNKAARLGLEKNEKRRVKRVAPPPRKEIIKTPQPEENKPIQRPPSVYSNKGCYWEMKQQHGL